MRTRKTRVSLIVMLCVVVSIVSTMDAYATITKHQKIRGNNEYYEVEYIYAYTTSNVIKPITDTQALHTKGVSTTIAVSSAIQKTSTSSASISSTVGVSYLGVSTDLAIEVGVAESVSHTVGASVSYTIPASKPTAYYRIEVVFPQYRITYKVFKVTPTSTTTLLNKTITSMPIITDAYHRCYKYA